LGLLILFVTLAVVISLTCSLMEATLLSVSSSYVRNLKNQNRKSGRILSEFKQDIDRPLAAILILNTIANTAGATAAGAQAEIVFQSRYLGIFAALFTLTILIVSEIIPKTIGAVYWRKTATFTAYLLNGIVFVLSPFITVTRFITRTITREKRVSKDVFREEIYVLAEIGEDMGALSKVEEKVIRNILRMRRIKVKEILTPRTVMMALESDTRVDEVIKDYPVLEFSRIPVYEETPDQMQGLVLRQDIIDAVARDEFDRQLKELVRPIHHIPQSLPAADALELFISRGEHIFLVVDEYGGTAGIVTLEDTMESLLGSEIVDEKDSVADLRELATRMWHTQLTGIAAQETKVEGVPGEAEQSAQLKEAEEIKKIRKRKE
jgi:CBS domain containing-hemolysin-like protein